MLLGITVLEFLQFGLVLALGLLPLAIVLWADPTAALGERHLRRHFRRPRWAKSGLIAVIAQWLTDSLS